jgi:hypothetical protein
VDISFEEKMRKYIALLTVFLLIFLSTAGCIDIHLAKDLLVPHKEDKVKWISKEFSPLASHNFTSNYVALEFIEHYEEDVPVAIVELTDHMRFDIEVYMRSAENIWHDIEELINGTGVGENIAPYIESILELLSQRYVEITILKPDGTEWDYFRTNETAKTEVSIRGPEEGDWMVEIVGDGMGIPSAIIPGVEIQDSFNINLLIRQPKE